MYNIKYDIKFVELYIKRHNLSKTAFCKRCNINTNQFNKFLNNQINFDVRVIFRIAKVLGVQAYELFLK